MRRGKSKNDFFDFDPNDIPSGDESDAFSSDLEELLNSFDCPDHIDEDCKRPRCFFKYNRRAVSRFTSNPLPTKKPFNRDLEKGAHLLDLDRSNRFQGKMKATQIRQEVRNIPLVAVLPAIAELDRKIKILPKCAEKEDLSNNFDALCQNLSFVADPNTSAEKILALNERTYREASASDADYAQTWRKLDGKSPHILWLQNARTSTHKDSDNPVRLPSLASVTRGRSNDFQPRRRNDRPRRAPPPSERTRRTSGKFNHRYPLSSWVAEDAYSKNYQSHHYKDFIVCQPFNRQGCWPDEERCMRVHECLDCHKLGHSAGVCKETKQRR